MEKVLYTGKKKSLKELPKERLEKMSTHGLLGVLKSVRAVRGSYSKSLYCDCCDTRQIDLGNWKNDVYREKMRAQEDKNLAEIDLYLATVKEVLATKEHIDRPGKPKKKSRKK